MNQSFENYENLGVNIFLKPTYAFVMPARSPRRGPLSEMQKNNLANLAKNTHDGKLSKKATTKLVNSVNWLVASAKKKWYYDTARKKHFSFRINFVTLTLPSSIQQISDHKFKSVLLHNFINQCRFHYDLKNFVWKVEAQANGNIHAHITSDTYLPWAGIRRIWNQILLKNGLLDLYQNKHRSMSFEDYNKAYNSKAEYSEKLMRKRFDTGVAADWADPNSTDVHAVYKVKDIGAYLAKYMSKKEEDRRGIMGRLWSCSYNISQANKLYVNLPMDMDGSAISTFIDGPFEFLEVFSKDKTGIPGLKVGELFFFKLRDLTSRITGPIGDLYRETLFNIRNNIQMEFNQNKNVVVEKPKKDKPKIKNEVKPIETVQTSLFVDEFAIGGVC